MLYEMYSALLSFKGDYHLLSTGENFDKCFSHTLWTLLYILGESLSLKSSGPKTVPQLDSGSLNLALTDVFPGLPFSL